MYITSTASIPRKWIAYQTLSLIQTVRKHTRTMPRGVRKPIVSHYLIVQHVMSCMLHWNQNNWDVSMAQYWVDSAPGFFTCFFLFGFCVFFRWISNSPTIPNNSDTENMALQELKGRPVENITLWLWWWWRLLDGWWALFFVCCVGGVYEIFVV